MASPNDTHPDVAKLQLELLRQATPQRRLELALDLSAFLITQSRQHLTQKYKDSGRANLEWVRFNYGDRTADKLEHHLYTTNL